MLIYTACHLVLVSILFPIAANDPLQMISLYQCIAFCLLVCLGFCKVVVQLFLTTCFSPFLPFEVLK